ncbi:Senescence regulator S40 [Dillenia turbinata]|uniref:Senescence regulator S40 n=1 Tax=Dillenia turbinata TaxID=194707 RepID=A0AAN8UI77_9MAGN
MGERFGVINTRSNEREVEEEEFEEEDVWGVMNEGEDVSPQMVRKSKDTSSSSSAWRVPTPSKMIPHNESSFSAPMKIPDRPRIYMKKNNNKKNYSNEGTSYCDNDDSGNVCYDDDIHDDTDEDVDGSMVPPHELIAKKLERSQISSFSVCEGVGRTLKGRDLSKVRNAILTKTVCNIKKVSLINDPWNGDCNADEECITNVIDNFLGEVMGNLATILVMRDDTAKVITKLRATLARKFSDDNSNTFSCR